jgi:peptide-methionine (S)-S-oxide reductase
MELATFAAGCFWGVQHIFDQIPGVLKSRVGYMGGHTKDVTYKLLCNGDTGHAEVVQLEFDPNKISYKELLNYFWRLHDPTQFNRQGVDVGTQYRSAIFFHSEKQQQEALESKKAFDDSKVFPKPAVTEITAVSKLFDGEEYHQKYFDKNGGHVCHVLRLR